MRKLTTNEFIQKAIKIHGNKYDYSKVDYKGSKISVCIICSKHGEFWQIPNYHISSSYKEIKGCGCPNCYNDERSFKQRRTLNEFINIAKLIHGNKYDYSKVNYINSQTKIEIICPIHGSFWQYPTSHLVGKGCYRCKFSKGEKFIELYLKESNIKFIPQYRFKDCRNKLPLPFDFYLPDYNICIEYDGKQHFNKESLWYSESIIKNDEIKNEYCKNNNIILLRISYKKLKEINNILNDELMKFCSVFAS